MAWGFHAVPTPRRDPVHYCPTCGGGRFWMSSQTCRWSCERCRPPAPGERPLSVSDTDHPTPPAVVITHRPPRPYRPYRAR